MEPLLETDQHFIIRQVGNRDLYHEDNRLSLKEISRMVKLSETFKVTKMKKNKTINETYDVDTVKVRLNQNEKDLYLPELALVNRKKLSDLFRFIFYKLAYAVKKLLSLSKFHGRKPSICRTELCLRFE